MFLLVLEKNTSRLNFRTPVTRLMKNLDIETEESVFYPYYENVKSPP